MLEFAINRDKDKKLQVLCLGAHSDDIEIGCGGTVLRLINDFPNISFYWIVFGSNQTRAAEANKSANTILRQVHDRKIVVKGFRDSFFPFIGTEIKEYFEQIKLDFSPDLIFTHYRNDLHQDHRLISDLTWNTFRDHVILEYEIPKYDGDFGSPNLFVNLNKTICQKKVKHLLTHFNSQRTKHWFDEETFFAILRLRGMELSSPGKYAEAFYCRKIVF